MRKREREEERERKSKSASAMLPSTAAARMGGKDLRS